MALEFGDEESLTASLSSPVELFSVDDMLLKSSVNDVYNDGVELEFKNERELSSEMGSEGCYSAEEGVISGHHFAVDAYDLATSNSSLRNGTPDFASSSNYSNSLSWNNCHKPFYFSSKLSAEIGSLETGNFLQSDLVDTASQKYGFKSWLEDCKDHGEMNNTHQWCMDNSQAVCITGLGSSVTKANIMDNIYLDFRDMDLTSVGGESEVFNPLADLSGDYDSHIRSLLYGQLCHGFSLAASVVHHPPSIPSRTENKKPWDIVCQSMPFWHSQFSQMSLHPVSMEQSICLAADSASPAYAFCSEGTQKARGTGIYFPCLVSFSHDLVSHVLDSIVLSAYLVVILPFMSCRMVLTGRDLHKGGAEIRYQAVAISFIDMDKVMDYILLQERNVIWKMEFMNFSLQKADLKAEGDWMHGANLLVQLEMGIKKMET